MTLTLVAQDAGSPAPFVDISSTGFPGGTSTVTVWRTINGRSYKVRGLVDLDATSGTVTGPDYEAPCGWTSTYKEQYLDSSGNLISWGTDTPVTTGSLAWGHAWVHNPFDASTSVLVRLLDSAAHEIHRPVDVETFRVPGRSVGLAIFSGTRHGVEKVLLDCFVESTSEADRFDHLFGDYDDDSAIPILCFRGGPELRLPPTLYATVADPTQLPIDTYTGGGTVGWKLEASECSPPPEAFVSALLAYADFSAFFASYATFTSAYASYLLAQRDYTKQGVAP